MVGTTFDGQPAAYPRSRSRLIFGREVWEWVGPLSGLAFVALIFAGTALSDPNSTERDINPEQSSAVIADLLVETRDDGRLGIAISMVGVFCLFWFVGYIHRRLRATGNVPDDLAIVALGGGLVTAATLLVMLHTELGLYMISDYGDETVVARTLAALSWEGVTVMAVPIAVFVTATSLSALLYGSLPRWLGWLGIPTVAVALVMYTAFLGVVLFFVWLILVAVMALVRPVSHQRGASAAWSA